ncbi:MAG TPA: hypothetical protein VF747_06580 [Blastocatellia bacterium]|jgi:molecular chaperone GrpE (heat shock protein)
MLKNIALVVMMICVVVMLLHSRSSGNLQAENEGLRDKVALLEAKARDCDSYLANAMAAQAAFDSEKQRLEREIERLKREKGER